MSTKREQRAGALYDYIVDGIEVTISEVEAHLGVPRRVANEAIRDLRLLMGEDDTINLVCVPNGQGKEWLYYFTDSENDAEPWLTVRTKDADSRFETMYAVAITDVRRYTGQTTREAKVARLKAKTFARLREDIGELTED